MSRALCDGAQCIFFFAGFGRWRGGPVRAGRKMDWCVRRAFGGGIRRVHATTGDGMDRWDGVRGGGGEEE